MTNRIINYIAFAILTLLWLGFGAAMLVQPELLESTWQMFRGWPLVLQVVVGILTLPVAIGLWVWQNASWPLLLRLVLILGLAWVTIYTFFPKETAAPSVTAANTN